MKTLLLLFVYFLSTAVCNLCLGQPTTIYTPKGSAVAATIYPEFSPSQIAQINYQVSVTYPNATIIANASNQYNCHSYAWHLSEGNTNRVWINTPEDDKYWNDGSFIEICNENEATKVSYANDDHSAIRSSASAPLGKYDSKWGDYPLLRHTPTYTPYVSTGRKYYVSTKVTGPAIICSSTTDVVYSIAATAITGASYSWTKSNNIILTGGTGSSVLARAVSGASGAGWIECAVNSPCGGIRTTSVNVQVGPYSTSQINVSGQIAVCPGNQYIYTASPSGSAYSWTWPSGWTKLNQAGNQITLSVPSSSPSGGAVRVSITNTCGASGLSGITVYPVSCGAFVLTSEAFIVYPNPANELLIVEEQDWSTTIHSSEGLGKVAEEHEPFTVALFNKMQECVARATSENGSVRIDTRPLPAGVYILHVSNRTKMTSKHIILE